jgi:hypothetical protein
LSDQRHQVSRVRFDTQHLAEEVLKQLVGIHKVVKPAFVVLGAAPVIGSGLQLHNLPMVEALRMCWQLLLEEDSTKEEVRELVQMNPAQLLYP